MHQRSDPDEILRQIIKHSAGRHKIYLGMAPGVGKTHKMLEEALELKKRGVDIAIGYLEPQNRKDNQNLINNFELLPQKKHEINNNIFFEFDLELTLERKPACIIIDELAHNNIPGSKNKKRYEDILELLQNGISVLSTINIHQIESIAPIIERNIQVQIKETVPDWIVKKADEIVVVDIPIDELYKRLDENKIYNNEQTQRAKQGFFKRNNLLMLRDLTLTYLAEKVDSEVLTQNLSARIKERILVAITPDENANNAINHAIDISKSSNADIDVACFTNDIANEEKLKAINNLRELIKEVKGNFILIENNKKSPVEIIYNHIRSSRTTLLIIEKAKLFIKKDLFKENLALSLLKKMPGLNILILNKKNDSYYSKDKDEKELNIGNPNIKHGHLKIIIGMAPGVGKTYKMLQEAKEKMNAGKKVLLGIIDTHGRVETAKQMEGLPTLPLKAIEHKDKFFHEFDLETAIIEKPDIIFIDELAHSNVPGSINNKRYQDVQYILRAGIDVVTTVNIQHIESLNDIIEQFSGIKVRETVPDWIISHANEIVLVDISPESLQERLKEGKVYSIDKIEQSLTNFFQKKNLVALRELSLREVAENVEQELYPKDKKTKMLSIIEINEETLKLIRKSARIANRHQSELIIAHIIKDTAKLLELRKVSIIELEELVVELGGDFRLIESQDKLKEIKKLIKKIHPLYVIISEELACSNKDIFNNYTLDTLIKEINDSHIWIIGERTKITN